MDELRERRKAKRLAEAPGEIAGFLNAYYQAAIDGTHTWEGDPPTGIVLISLGPSGPEVDWGGYVTKEDLRMAEQAIGDVLHPERPEIRRQNEEYNRKRVEEYERTHPFKCSHPRCSTRLKSDAGRKIHERSCYWIKGDEKASQTMAVVTKEGHSGGSTSPLQDKERSKQHADSDDGP